MKALIITPTPTHPTNAGNRKIIVQTCNTFLELGFELDCVYFPLERYDYDQMAAYFKGRLFIPKFIGRNKYRRRLNSLRNIISRKFTKIFYLPLKEKDKDSLKYNSFIDAYIPEEYVNWFIKKIDLKAYELVICEYVWTSKLLEYFPKKIFKIIDTHDVFSNRYRTYQRIALTPDWVSLFPSQEAKGLKRANLLICLNEDERNYLESLSGVKSICYSFMPDLKFIIREKFEYKLAYFASNNNINIQSIEWFIEDVLPLIHSSESQTRLIIGGTISSSLMKYNSHPNIDILGEFEIPYDFYIQADVIINPEQSGTGLKIKAVEAFSFGLPLVATKMGAKGADTPFLDHYLEANTAGDFASAVLELFKNPNKRQSMINNSKNWLAINKNKSQSGLILNLKTAGFKIVE